MSNNNPNLPNLGGPQPPNLGGGQGPNLGGPSTGPIPPQNNVEENESKPVNETDLISQTEKKSKLIDNKFELVRKFGVIQRRMLRSLQSLVSLEFKTKVHITKITQLYRDFVFKQFQGQITYLEEMIDLIKDGKDPLSKEYKKKRKNITVSYQVFETLIDIITEEMKRFDEEKPRIMDFIEEDLKSQNDARLEPRICFWVLITTGLAMENIEDKEKKAFDIVFKILTEYWPSYRRALAVYYNFCYYLIKEIDPYPVDSCRVNLIYGPSKTGYNMGAWIKYRYGTNSQTFMEYERYLYYFARSFGIVRGRSPDFKNGPKDGFQNWINRTLTSLEKLLLQSPTMRESMRGETLEGILVGIRDDLKKDLEKRELDDYGKVINQPIGGEGALKFIEWLFETAINRYDTTNIATHGKIRLSIDMFDFVETTSRWVNQYGERLTMEWLKKEEETEEFKEEIIEVSEEDLPDLKQ